MRDSRQRFELLLNQASYVVLLAAPLAVLTPAAAPAQEAAPRPFLRKVIQLDDAQLAAVEKGEVVTKLLRARLRGGRRAMVAAILLTMAVPTWGRAQGRPTGAMDDQWHFNIAPNFWATGVQGELTVARLPPVTVDASFSDILENVDIGLAARFEARKNHFGFGADLVWMNLGATAVDTQLVDLSVDFRQLVVEGIGFYRVASGGRANNPATRFLVDGRGVVTYARRLWVKLAYPLDFRDFPLDRHRWKVTVWPVTSRTDEIVFHALRVTGMNERLSIQGWHVGEPRAEASTGPRVARPGTFARFDVELPLERNWGYHAWKLGVPLTLIVLMAYGVYFIPASAVPQQIGLGMTSMLTLIAYMLTLGGTLPRIGYLTRADRFFVGSAVLVFLGLVKAVAAIALGQKEEARILERLTEWGRWLFPVAILANFALAFLF